MTDAAMTTELIWDGGDRFSGTVGQARVTLDGDAEEEMSPMQAVAAGLAACMAIDVRMILERGRVPLAGLRARLEAERAENPPRRFVGFRLHFAVELEASSDGQARASKVERAIELSRSTYCSVWHSLNHESGLVTSFEIV